MSSHTRPRSLAGFAVCTVLAFTAACSRSGDPASAVPSSPKTEPKATSTAATDGGHPDSQKLTVEKFYGYRAKGDFAAAFDMMGTAYHGYYNKEAWIAAMKEIDAAAGGFKRADTAAWKPQQAVRVEYGKLSVDEHLYFSESSAQQFMHFVIDKPQTGGGGASQAQDAASQGEPITDPATSLTFEQIADSIAKNRPADLINRMKFEQRMGGGSTPWHLLAGSHEMTLLHFAALHGATDSAAELIGLGTPVDVLAERNSTPLHLAACTGRMETVKLLVSRGANVSRANDTGLTPADCAKAEGKLEVAAWLESQSAGVAESPFEPLWRLDAKAEVQHDQICAMTSKAMRQTPNHPETIAQVKKLIDDGYFSPGDSCFVIEEGPPDSALHQMNAAVRGERGRGKVTGNILSIAAAVGSTEIVKHAVENDFDPSAGMYAYTTTNGTRGGGPAILLAAQNGHADVVKLLIDKGANPRAVDTGTMRFILDYVEDPAIRRMLLDAAAGKAGGPH